jgi:hypothetical protein
MFHSSYIRAKIHGQFIAVLLISLNARVVLRLELRYKHSKSSACVV